MTTPSNDAPCFGTWWPECENCRRKAAEWGPNHLFPPRLPIGLERPPEVCENYIMPDNLATAGNEVVVQKLHDTTYPHPHPMNRIIANFDPWRRIRELEAELELERLRLAVCGNVAKANTRETAAKARDCSPEMWSATAGDVAAAVDEQIILRANLRDLERRYYRNSLTPLADGGCPKTEPCCAEWPKIRPHLGWFETDAPEPGALAMPVIGPAVSDAVRVNFCPSCGTPVRNARWKRAEQEAADD